MKLPTYEQQNEFLRKYVAPLFEFNLAKVLRNYRMSKSVTQKVLFNDERLPEIKEVLDFNHERMAQIRKDVLAEIKEKGEKYSDHVYDRTFDTDNEEVREVSRISPNLATLHMTFTKPLPLEKLMQRDYNRMFDEFAQNPLSVKLNSILFKDNGPAGAA